jgi:hypothetical protein
MLIDRGIKMINEYDKVRLKSGEIARIVEVLEDGKMYVGEIIRANRHVEVDHIPLENIASVFVETEQPLAIA